MGTKFINFLCYELGKGSMLCRIRDCTKRLEEVGTVEATYIAHEMIASVRLISACTNYYYFSNVRDVDHTEWLVPNLCR